MTDELAVGNLIWCGLPGTELSGDDAQLLKRLQPSGIILFRHNIMDSDEEWVGAMRKLIADAQDACGRELFVTVDHEGGRVHRLRPPVTHFPAAATWGAKTQEVTTAMAVELRALSYNVSLFPVLDIFSEPTNMVIGDRSFSTTPDSVAAQGLASIEALHKAGVLACGKHFPGHGATTADSHYELPVLDVDLETLRTRELVPFSQACGGDLRLMMTAHVLYPQLDTENPATFSSRILNDLLRGELGYRHAIISDDIEMEGASAKPLGPRCVAALDAGVSILLVGNPKDKQPIERALVAFDGVSEAFKQGEISRQKIDAALEQVYALREFQRELLANAPAEESYVEMLGCDTHQELCRALREID